VPASLLLAAIALPLCVAPALPALTRRFGWRTSWLAALVAGLSAAFTMAAGLGADWSYQWLPSLGPALALSLDGFGLLMSALIGGIGAAILIYAGGYSRHDPHLGRLLAWLVVFVAAMQALVLADDLLLLFAAWEVTSFASFMLVGHSTHLAEARAAARRALLVTAGGGLCLLGGVVLLADAAGTWRLSELAVMTDHSLYPAIAILFIVAAATKSAQFPFHFWLPGAMCAPTPVSAYLHSATMVKAGIVLLVRMQPSLSGSAWWELPLLIAGGLTIVVAAWRCAVAVDLKALLAGTTLIALGCMTVLAGIATPSAMAALVVFLLAHALYKAAAFMLAGAIDHGAGTRDLRVLAGLRRAMPWSAGLAGVIGLSLLGLAPSASFVAKELLLAVAIESGPLVVILFGLAAISFAFAAVRVCWAPFAGRPSSRAEHAHEVDRASLIAIAMVAIPALALGPLLAAAHAVLEPAVAAAGGTITAYQLGLWHGVSAPLVIGLFAITSGLIAGLLLHRRLRAWLRTPRWWDAAAWHDALWVHLVALAKRLTETMAAGGPRAAAALCLAVTALLVLGVIVTDPERLPLPAWNADASPLDLAALALTLLGAGGCIAARSRMAAVCALGAVGTGVTLIFLAHSAPDLAVTQFLVEVLTVLLVMLAFRRLSDGISDSGSKLIRAGVALSIGATVFVLVLVAQGTQLGQPVGAWHAAAAIPEGHGRNVVNVILVDFRAFDTLGEIAVLAIAAIGAGVLLARHRKLEPAT
jgi:multicomponent Na+:H+ antiporter subunit A